MKMEFGHDKLCLLFRQFTLAPNLKVVKIDLDKINPKVCLEPLLTSTTALEELFIRNVTWEFGLSFLKDLETNKSIKKVVIQFLKFTTVHKHHQIAFT